MPSGGFVVVDGYRRRPAMTPRMNAMVANPPAVTAMNQSPALIRATRCVAPSSGRR